MNIDNYRNIVFIGSYIFLVIMLFITYFSPLGMLGVVIFSIIILSIMIIILIILDKMENKIYKKIEEWFDNYE